MKKYRGSNDTNYEAEFILEPISKQNIIDVKHISVNDNQTAYVASISDALIQASFLKNWHGFILRADKDIVGFGSYADYEKVPGAVKIFKLIVDKNHQGKGYGKVLLDLLINKINSPDIWIDLHSDNVAAKNLYLKRFEVVSDDGSTTVMKLKLVH